MLVLIFEGIQDSGAPEISVASDGSIYIVWLGNNSRDVKFVKSVDGGDTFTDPTVVAKDIVPLLIHILKILMVGIIFLVQLLGWELIVLAVPLQVIQ